MCHDSCLAVRCSQVGRRSRCEMEGSSLLIMVSENNRVTDVPSHMVVTQCVSIATHSTQWEDPRLLAKNKPTAVSPSPVKPRPAEEMGVWFHKGSALY